MAWARDPDLRPLMGAPITEHALTGYPPDRTAALEEAIVESNEFQANLARFRGATMRLDMPIIKGFANGLVDPGGVIGTPNVGRCIFEDTRLDNLDDKLANCDVVVCASRWNADMLKAKTRKRVEIIYEGIDDTLFRPGPRPGLLDRQVLHLQRREDRIPQGHDLVLLAFEDPRAVTTTRSWSPHGIRRGRNCRPGQGEARCAAQLAADGTIHVKKWVASNRINPDKVIKISKYPVR